jgi:hypothetical protein
MKVRAKYGDVVLRAETPAEIRIIRTIKNMLTKGAIPSQHKRQGLLYPEVPRAADSDSRLTLVVKKISTRIE